jgi:hypothetical protein
MLLIWHADDLVEQDWLRFLFDDLIEQEVLDLDFARFDDNSIHVVSSNESPLPACKPYFEKLRARCKNIVLVHVSDEYFSGGYQAYKYFDLAIRWNHTYMASHPGILTVPLGYPNRTGNSVRPLDQRQYVWSFVGEIKSSRIAMAAAFNGFTPQFLTDSLVPNCKLTKSQFDAVLEDTVFAPCPMGNVTIDTGRIYESLEFGCIPLVELRLGLDYYKNLFGPNPLPAFRNWTDARRFAEATFNDKAALMRLQAEIRNWWTSYKTDIRAQVRANITGPSQNAALQHYGALLRNRTTFLHQPLRVVELLRHQTVNSLMRRLARPGGPIRRIVRDVGVCKSTVVARHGS